MARLFRLACALDAYFDAPDRTVRPPKPRWLLEENRANATRSQAHSFNYWTKIYWATPPWISREQVDAMRRIYEAPPGEHVDHIVPLSSPIVCGLHVPWNLQRLPDKTNLAKSNDMWPDHPCEPQPLFERFEGWLYHQLRLAL